MSERIKNYLGIAITLAVLASGFSALSYVNSYARATEPSSFRSFSTSGEGKAVAVPDIAQFSFNVITEGGADIARLQRDNTEKVNRAIKFLKDNGIAAKDIRTANYNLTPRYQSTICDRRALPAGGSAVCPPPSIAGYSINQGVTVKVRDFAKIGEVLAGVVERGANSVSQLNFTVDDQTAVENDARAEAIAKAKSKAEAVARAGGFRLGRLLGIEEGGFPGPFYRGLETAAYGIGGDAAAPLPAPSIEPGSTEVQVTVTLRYEIE